MKKEQNDGERILKAEIRKKVRANERKETKRYETKIFLWIY